MQQRCAHGSPRPTVAAGIVIAMLAMLVIPAAIALHSVVTPATVQAVKGASPHGYTWSLLLFLVPIAVIAVWLLPSEGLEIPRSAFVWTIAITGSVGCLLMGSVRNGFSAFPIPRPHCRSWRRRLVIGCQLKSMFSI